MRLSHLLIASLPLVAVVLGAQVQNAQVTQHTETLQKAPSMTLTVTAQKLGGSPDEYTLTLSKPNMLKLDSANRTLVTDGKMIWDYDKKAKTYTEDAATPESMKALLTADNLWIWCAFFDADFAKTLASAKAGSSRNLKGNPVKELMVTLAKDQNKAITLFIDDKLKFARGADIKVGETEMIYTATKIEIGTAAGSASDFIFTAPADAKKLDKAAVDANAPKFADISNVFMTSCAPCHTQESKGRLNLSSYMGVMRGGGHGAIVVAGDSKNSNLFKYMRGQGRPQMPPNGKIAEADIAKLEKWVDGGAKE